MSKPADHVFIPVLTVMVDYGNAPFLWIIDCAGDAGVGGMICDGTGWDECCPMSEGLWRKFADWACEFDRTAFYADSYDADDWDWIAFHARGLQLARWLKDEVGKTYRVVYEKPYEDPNHQINERTEVLHGGKSKQLPPLAAGPKLRPCHKIISGGQAGADRAALDFAIAHGFPHGGWCPRGRRAEDGSIPLKYQLVATDHARYRARTVRNVSNSDATLILNMGELDGGSLETRRIAEKRGKPVRVVSLDVPPSGEELNQLRGWLRVNAVACLNVAGPRESKRPGIHRAVCEFLERLWPAAG